MPKYRPTATAYMPTSPGGHPVLLKSGEVVEHDGEPCSCMAPLDEAAHAAVAEDEAGKRLERARAAYRAELARYNSRKQ
jgi:hypothetical protein